MKHLRLLVARYRWSLRHGDRRHPRLAGLARRWGVAAIALAFLPCTAAFAQSAPFDDVQYDFYAWARYAAGAPASAVRGGGGLYVTGPLAILPRAQMGVGLSIESLPDKGSFSFTDLGSWGNYVEVTGHAAYRLAERELESGRISMDVISWGGFTFDSFGATAPDALEPRRAQRHYAGGLRFQHVKTDGHRSWVAAGWGTDDANRPLVSSPQEPSPHAARFRQLLITGSVHVKGPVYIDARTGVAFGGADQPDYFTGGIRTSLPDLISRK